MVILPRRITPVEWSFAFLVIGIAPLVPVLAQTLVTTVFHCPHGVFLRLVDVQHLATVFRLVDVQHLAASNGSSAVWVIQVAYGLHLQHVFSADALVATLVEEDAGIVPVVYDGVAHEFRTLCPACAFHVLLRVASRHSLNEAHTVARLYVLLPRCHVHPAHHITA